MQSKLTTFVAGLLVALFATHAYTVYQMRAQMVQNTVVIQQIVSFINQANAPKAQTKFDAEELKRAEVKAE